MKEHDFNSVKFRVQSSHTKLSYNLNSLFRLKSLKRSYHLLTPEVTLNLTRRGGGGMNFANQQGDKGKKGQSKPL